MSLLKFKSINRKYDDDSSWNLYDNNKQVYVDKEEYDVSPTRDKLFNQDTIVVNDKNEFVKIIHSCNRIERTMPAILSFNKMYGKTSNNKYYFRATPDDIRVPEFLVPYKLKKSEFLKKVKSRYVVIRYVNWNEKHPIGQIISSIGDVEILPHFYEYMLYCKSLNTSLQQFTQNTMLFLKKTNEKRHIREIIDNPNYNIETRGDEWNIICIDPKMSKDFDDGFSVNKTIYNEKNATLLSIYISNVPIWLDSMNLWDSFSERISTIYLPDRKRPMLPSILSDKLCSLQSGKTRIAIVLDIYINSENTIVHHEYKNVAISISNNYDYDDTKGLLNDKTYTNAFNLISHLNHYSRYKHVDKIIDSHDIVAYLMVLMNYISATDLRDNKAGIFRTIKLKESHKKIPSEIPTNIKQFLTGWNSSGGKYVKFSEYDSHDMLNLDAYVHITSPIRRIVDILNIMTIMKVKNLNTFQDDSGAQRFLDKWTSPEKFEYINVSMRSIRRLQNKCEILEKCHTQPELLNKTFTGFCFDKLKRADGFYQYVVYLPELKMINKFTDNIDIDNYSERDFQLFLFKDEASFKQKIKMNIVV